MSDRLTVVFDDSELYRKLKVHAAEEGVPMKTIIQEAIAAYLERTGAAAVRASAAGPRELDWDQWDSFQSELDAIAEEPSSEDASDIKQHLYGLPARELTDTGWRWVAEEQAEYDAR